MSEMTFRVSPSGARRFPLSFRIEFMRQWDECVEHGSKVRLMRQYNLTTSTVERWRKARDQGELTAAMVAASEGSRARMDNRDRSELARLRLENKTLKARVEKSEAAQEILGKAFELLKGINESSSQDEQLIPPALMSADEYANWLKREQLS